MNNNLKHMTWLPESSEVLTDVGWVGINKLSLVKDIVIYNNISNKLEYGSLSEFSKFTYSGDVDICRGTIYYEGFIIPYDGIFLSTLYSLPSTTEKKYYEGILINLQTSSNNFFARCLENGLDNEDYLLVKCNR